MPAGISNPVIGYSVFCAIKLVGYCTFAALLAKTYKRDRNAIAVGSVRTVIGMAAGAAYFFLMESLRMPGGGIGYLAGLVPLRIAEWWVLLAIFFRPLKSKRDSIAVTCGVIYSFILDIPAILGFIATAGFWVC